jgi:uncharacterized membrane protein (UPF0136 family)
VKDEAAEGSSHLLSSFMCRNRNGGVRWVPAAFTSIFAVFSRVYYVQYDIS